MFPDFRASYREGTAYHVVSPALEGFTPDSESLSGVLSQDTVLDVVYTRNTYQITVRRKGFDGKEIAPAETLPVLYGTPYVVGQPQAENLEDTEYAEYTAVIPEYMVMMPGRDLELSMYYLGPDDEDLTLIDDYEAPLGLGSVFQASGMCFE